MFIRSAALAGMLVAATVAATPPERAVINAPVLQALLAPGSPGRTSIISRVQAASGPITDEYKPPASDFPPPVETSIDIGVAAKPAGAAQCGAQITHVKGELTSQGYMVIEGSCFGPSGSIVVSGFPNGNPNMIVQAWTPTAITAQFPKISGVPDLVMHVAVTHGAPGTIGQLSSLIGAQSFDAKFTAAIGDPVPLPSKYIAMNDCGGALPICLAAPPAMAIGVHVDATPGSGADIWTFSIPDHWHLSGVRIVHLSQSAASSSTINGTGALKTVKVAWTESAIEEHADSTSQCSPAAIAKLGSLWGPLMQQFCAANPAIGVLYAANYRIEPMVRGPAGMTVPGS